MRQEGLKQVEPQSLVATPKSLRVRNVSKSAQ